MVVEGIERTAGARRVGGVSLGRLLGTGVHSTVWLGHGAPLARPVAVKILADKWAGNPAIRRDFAAAAHWSRHLVGDGLIGVLAAGALEDGRPYVIVEWADLGSLADRLRQGPLPLSEAIQVAIAVAQILGSLHQRNATHGNLTPANVLLATDEAGVQRIVLSDPVPPRSADGADLDPRADVHATGALLLTMVVDRASPTATGRLRRRRTPSRPLDALVRRTLHPNPAKRPVDGLELAAALQRLADANIGLGAARVPARSSTPDRPQASTLQSPRANFRVLSSWPRLRRRRLRRAWLIAAGLVLVGAGWAAGSRLFPDRSVDVVLESANLTVTVPVRAGDRMETSERILGDGVEVLGVVADSEDVSPGPGPAGRVVFVGSTASLAADDLGGISRQVACASRVTEPWTARPGASLSLSGVITTSTSCESGVDYVEATVSSPTSGRLVYAVVEDGARTALLDILASLRPVDE